MRKVTISLLALSTLLAVACTKEDKRPNPTAPPEPAPAVEADLAKRGAYLVGVGGCSDCHTPMKFDPALGMPVPDMARRLSGHPAGAPDPSTELGKADQAVIGPTFTSFKAPFGIVYAANLTSDAQTGIGLWTDEEFVRAIRTGRHRGAESGRPILPPMPWMGMNGSMSDDDLKAVLAYLKTVPAVKNAVPEPNVPPPVYAAMSESYDKVLAASKASRKL
ncbi:MAG: diheme cytochrome c-553 [Labilithrix sp.]|nr:diheme cytochrome c-553 [Labilithrix sp.]